MVYIKTKAIQHIHLDISNRSFMSMTTMYAVTPVPHNHWTLISFSCCNRFRTREIRENILPQHFYRNCYNPLGTVINYWPFPKNCTGKFMAESCTLYMLQLILLHINKESTFTLQLSTPVEMKITQIDNIIRIYAIIA